MLELTLEELARALGEQIARIGGPTLRYDAASFSLVDAAGGQRIPLGNLYAEVRALPPEARARRIERTARAFYARRPRPTLVLDEIMPVVREGLWFQATRLERPGEPAMFLEHRPLDGLLAVGLAVDAAERMVLVNRGLLEEWFASFDGLLARAVENLDERSRDDDFTRVADGVFAARWGDDHDAARLLLRARIAALGLSVPVALVGGRDSLLLVDGDDDDALLHGAALLEAARAEPHAVRAEPLRLARDRWIPFEPEGGPAREPLRRLGIAARLAIHDEQRHLLAALLGKTALPAKLEARTRRADGEIVTFTVWMEGVPSWLPRADRVIFTQLDGRRQRAVGWAPWDSVVEVMGLAPDDLAPPRYHTSRFPTGAELRAMRLEANAMR